LRRVVAVDGDEPEPGKIGRGVGRQQKRPAGAPARGEADEPIDDADAYSFVPDAGVDDDRTQQRGVAMDFQAAISNHASAAPEGEKLNVVGLDVVGGKAGGVERLGQRGQLGASQRRPAKLAVGLKAG